VQGSGLFQQVLRGGAFFARDQRWDVKLCRLSKHVRSVFELVRMHRIFDIFETRQAAVQAFEQPPRRTAKCNERRTRQSGTMRQRD
jgi:hypothetical protein